MDQGDICFRNESWHIQRAYNVAVATCQGQTSFDISWVDSTICSHPCSSDCTSASGHCRLWHKSLHSLRPVIVKWGQVASNSFAKLGESTWWQQLAMLPFISNSLFPTAEMLPTWEVPRSVASWGDQGVEVLHFLTGDARGTPPSGHQLGEFWWVLMSSAGLISRYQSQRGMMGHQDWWVVVEPLHRAWESGWLENARSSRGWSR